MASNYNSLGFNLMTTGENAGTWGTNTNLNLNYLRDTFGYISIAMTSDRTLTIPDNSTGTYDGRAFIIELTGTLGGTRVLDIAATAGSGSSPGGSASILKPFIVFDNTTHSGDTLTFKVTGQTGFALSEGRTYLCYHNGTDIINTGLGSGDMSDVADDASPQLGGDLDVVTYDLVSTSNRNIDFVPNGTGTVRAKDGGGTTSAIKIAGKDSIWIPSTAITPTVSNGCATGTRVETTSGRPDLDVLDFDASSDEHAQFSIAFPKSWNASTITFQVFWTTTATDTDGVAWGLQGVACANDNTIDVAYGTAIVVTDDNLSAAEDCMVTAESSAVTIAGSPGDDELCFFRIFRDVSDGNDDMTEDARLLGVKLFFTTDSANDA
jgi:hypothetical protein